MDHLTRYYLYITVYSSYDIVCSVRKWRCKLVKPTITHRTLASKGTEPVPCFHICNDRDHVAPGIISLLFRFIQISHFNNRLAGICLPERKNRSNNRKP